MKRLRRVGETSEYPHRSTPTGDDLGVQKRNTRTMTLKERLFGAGRQIRNALRTHQGSIERGIDKAGDLANQRTGTKYDQKIRKGTSHLRAGLAKVTGNPSSTPGADNEPPAR